LSEAKIPLILSPILFSVSHQVKNKRQPAKSPARQIPAKNFLFIKSNLLYF
jgi:hypothetical protein